jgi:hypothetical protein
MTELTKHPFPLPSAQVPPIDWSFNQPDDDTPHPTPEAPDEEEEEPKLRVN